MFIKNRRSLFYLTILAIVSLAGNVASAAWPALKKGDILVTRNAAVNVVPGYWNHAAMYDGAGSVIEAQAPGSGGRVKKTPLTTFVNTYPTIRVYRPNAQYLTNRMVDYGNSLVGKKYQDVWGSGYNCVMVVRLSYYYASLAYTRGGDDRRWVVPDDIVRDRNLLYVGGK